ncbi:MAG: peptidase C1, partial [Deltaproteobacteria bacterium]|nr:peptidase C1 [Deltaproteobacteria bacterium]
PLFHFPPQAQYMTGTCWAFAGISFLESEVQRLTGQEVKLSELYPVYWEYVEKAREYVRTRGASAFSEGSQLGAVLRMFELHGAVPLAAYRGVAAEDGRHDHQRLFRELSGFLQHVKATGLWDEELVTGTVRSILDRHLGPPPERFEHGGATFTPAEFLEQVLRLRPGDYVEFMSTTSKAFWTQAEFEVPDNWWHDASYWNVPLEDFYKVLLSALRAGFTAGIGGDVSEPGKVPEQDVAFVPTFDIPPDRIDQDAREYRIWNGSTGDDHGIHAVGLGRMKGHDWFLIKDSGRSARKGKHEGYYFFRGDFIRLKMLTILVHRDAARDLLETIRKRQASSTSASVAP